MENYTELLSCFADRLQYEDLSPYIVEQTKKFIVDYYAASFAGYQINHKFNSIAMDVIRESGGAEQSSILFEQRKYPASNAAFMNAAYAHGADMDDGNRNSAGHIGTHVISAVFALGEKLDITWKDIIVAINIGYDFFNRIAGAAQPSLYNKGFHSTGIAGAMACGAACAKLMCLDMDGIYNTVSLSAIQSSGLIIIDESGQGCKPINPANAARTGVISALMAEKGLISSRNPLESMKGWFHAYSDSVDEKVLLDGLGTKFTIGESYLKLYPTCRHTHSCIDAALEIRKGFVTSASGSFPYKDVREIRVHIYPSAIKSAGIIRYPENSEEAKFSIQYALAITFVRGRFELSDLDAGESEDGINYLIERTVLFPDSTMENRLEGIRGSRVQVIMSDGQVTEKTIRIPRGEGDISLEWGDLKDKMRRCSKGLIEKDESDNFVEKLMNLYVNERFITDVPACNIVKRK